MPKDIHKGGRPRLYDENFYKSIVDEYETNTISQLCKLHGVSRATICLWLKKGREGIDAEYRK